MTDDQQFLFQQPVANYSSTSFPAPRDFQVTAHEKLRQGVAAGHMRQLLVAPTGSGKTYLGLRASVQALIKGRRALFVCDRTALIDQTSQRADEYGMTAHGIVQANHWRRDKTQPFQIASVQTISARGFWPDAEVIIIDEAHTQYSTWVEHLKTTKAAVIGLTATPCSRGLGHSFTNMVNAATMNELTQSGVLVPMRILSCTKPDMTGAATAGGEWTDKAASEREAQIIGDVVAEWIKHGENRKTIAFGADIAYCNLLCQRFNEAGVAADMYTSETKSAQRIHLLKEFSKPDSKIRILISVEALAKGFDVQDIGCVIDARPLRKSLSTAIQMWGRGLRSSDATGKTDCLLLDHCIASGQRVLTDSGLVPIESVTLAHKLWDGHEFVSHGGVVSRGIRPIIRYAGLTATADHPVKTSEGWRTLGHCADEQTPIVTTGFGRTALRERDDCFTAGGMARRAAPAVHACVVRMRYLRVSLNNLAVKFAGWAHKGMPGVQSAATGPEVALCQGREHETALHQSKGSQIQGLRRPRDRVPFRLSDHLRSLDCGESGDSGETGDDGTGPEEQRRALRGRKFAVGEPQTEHEQYAGIAQRSAVPSISRRASGGPLRRFFAAAVALAGTFIRGNHSAMEGAQLQAKGQVWDILDVGPRNSFTCEGLLVHNSGNILRFYNDFVDVYFNGFHSLDMAEKLDGTVRKDEEQFELYGCPACGHKPFMRRCMSCGFEKPTMVLEDSTAGEMREIRIGKNVIAADSHDLYRQLCAYVRGTGNPDTQGGRAYHLFKDITGNPPPRDWRFEPTENAPINRGTVNKIRSLRIAYIKGKQSGQRRREAIAS